MNLAKKILHKFTDEPAFELRFHAFFTVFWFIAAFPVCIFLSNSIPFVVFISVYAIVIGHWSAFQASKGEERIMRKLKL